LIEGDSSPSTATTESPTTTVSSDATEGEREREDRQRQMPVCNINTLSLFPHPQVPCPHLVSAQGWANGGLEWQ
ncbi:hypothetical protein KIPB_003401, partial [Kipferlia bialata]